MGEVRRSNYRLPPTPEGLKKMEEGTLRHFDIEMFSNLNTEVLEEYLDEMNRNEGFARSRWDWRKILMGLLIGMAFAMINQYVGLKIGLITGGAWYMAYLVGMAFRWSPTEVNMTAGTATGADRTCTGFVFTYPAIFLLAYAAADNPVTENYLKPGGTGTFISTGDIPPLAIAYMAAVLAALLGIMYFIIFRRIWLVEDPLPMPGFQAAVKLMDITKDLSSGSSEEAKRSLRIVTFVGGSMAFFTFLRDFPIAANNHKEEFGTVIVKNIGDEKVRAWKPDAHIPILDHFFFGKNYRSGEIKVADDVEASKYTHLGYEFTGIQLAIGWFMKFRTAFLVSLGTLFTWYFIVPLAVWLEVPAYVPVVPGSDPAAEGHISPLYLVETLGLPNSAAAYFAYGRIARVMAIGAILGGGFTGLLKMAPTFKTATADIQSLLRGGKAIRKDFVAGRGWYEWPVTHIPVMAAFVLVAMTVVFAAGGFPVGQSLAFSFVLIIVTFILGAIAIKVAGEVGITPVSGTSFITLLLLVGVFTAMGTDHSTTAIMALFGTTIFGTAISLSSDITYDFKVGLYCGTRPFHLMRGEMTGIVFGTLVAAFFATIFSKGLVDADINLAAPQAHAFATFTQIVMGGKVQWNVFILGIAIGVFMELLTGMGTAFGLGMYLPIQVTLPFLVGGGARDLWERRVLEPRAKRENWDERKKTMKLLETYMIATGLLVGEAVMGAIIAVYMITM